MSIDKKPDMSNFGMNAGASSGIGDLMLQIHLAKEKLAKDKPTEEKQDTYQMLNAHLACEVAIQEGIELLKNGKKQSTTSVTFFSLNFENIFGNAKKLSAEYFNERIKRIIDNPETEKLTPDMLKKLCSFKVIQSIPGVAMPGIADKMNEIPSSKPPLLGRK